MRKQTQAAELRIHTGADFTASAPNNRIATGAGATLDFSPQWTDSSADLAGLAYATYQFNLADAAAVSELTASWNAAAAPAAGQAWIGLSNWAGSRWDWLALPVTGALAVAQMANYADGAGDVLAIVALTGAQAATLNWLRLGDNAPPVMVLSVSDATGRAPRDVQYDATGCRDIDGSIANYEWDWLSDGIYDFAGATESQPLHRAWLGGTCATTLRVTDDQGLSATGSVAFTLDEHSDWWNAGHDRNNSRQADVNGPFSLSAASVPLWEFDLIDGPVGVLLGIDGTVYAGTRNGVVYAIDALSGEELHRFVEGTGYLRLKLIGPDRAVYVHMDNGNSTSAVLALNPDLSERWRITYADGARTILGFSLDGALLLGWENNYVRAVDPLTHARHWDYQLPDVAPVAASVGDDGAIFCSTGDTMAYGLTAAGTALGAYWVRAQMTNAPVINAEGNLVCVAGQYLTMFSPDGTELMYLSNDYAIDAGTPMALGAQLGEERYLVPLQEAGGLRMLKPDLSLAWKYVSSTAPAYSIITGRDGKIYLGDRAGWLECLKPNKNPQWTSFSTGQIYAAVHAIAADGTLYVSTQGDYMLRAYHD